MICVFLFRDSTSTLLQSSMDGLATHTCLGGLEVMAVAPQPPLLHYRQVAGNLPRPDFCCGAGRTPRAPGPQCSRSAGPAPARSALQAGRNRARIPPARPPSSRPSQVSAPGPVPHAPCAPGQRARGSLPWWPSGALRRLQRPRSLLLLPSTPFGSLEPSLPCAGPLVDCCI